MADFFIKRGDLKPSITSTLTDSAGDPVSLVGAEVTFLMREIDSAEAIVNAPAEIISASAATVRYEWASGDTDVEGGYYSEWEVSFADGTTGTFPNSGYDTIAILEDLGDAGS